MFLKDPTDLRIPGPTPVPPEVIEAMGQPMLPHRSAEMVEVFNGVLSGLKTLFNTEHDVFVIASTGSAGWEVSIVNCLAPGDKVLAGVNGNFGVRFVDVARHFGIDVVPLEVEWGQPITGDAVREALKQHPDVKAVQVVHNETSTGVLNPMHEIGAAVREHGALFFVDSVSGAAGAPVEMDDWPADIVFTGSQKALMCPPGLSIIGVSDRVWQYTKDAPIPRFMFDLERIRAAARAGSTPSTAPVGLIFGLKAALDKIEAEGLDALYARHQRLGEYTRAQLRKLGLEPIAEPDYASPTVTVARVPEGTTSGAMQKALHDRHGIFIATGQGHIQDSVIRIGHMGWTEEEELRRTFEALEDVLEHVPLMAD